MLATNLLPFNVHKNPKTKCVVIKCRLSKIDSDYSFIFMKYLVISAKLSPPPPFLFKLVHLHFLEDKTK